jgi:hypothetical protein
MTLGNKSTKLFEKGLSGQVTSAIIVVHSGLGGAGRSLGGSGGALP